MQLVARPSADKTGGLWRYGAKNLRRHVRGGIVRTGRRADDRPARPRHRFQLFHVLQPHAGMTYARSDSSRLVQLAFAKVDLLCEPTEPTAVWRIFISWITHRVSLLINLIKYQDPTRVKLPGPVGSLFSWPFDHLDDEPSSAAEELAQVGVAKFPRTACTSLPPRIWPSKRMREREKPNGRRGFFFRVPGGNEDDADSNK